MFAKILTSCLQFDITELPDGPPQHHVKLDPQPYVREVTPPPAPVAKSVNQKGPEVYYPPGAEFSKRVQPAVHPVADGGSLSLNDKRKGEMRVRDKHELQNMESGDKQGAAVIPICLPLCCAAPCVIM